MKKRILMLLAVFVAFGCLFKVPSISKAEEVSETTTTTTEIVEEKTDTDTLNEDFDFGTWLQSYFTPEVIASIMSVITTLAVVLKMASTIKSLTKEKGLTASDVCDKVVNTLQSTNKEEIDKMVNEVIEPLCNKVNDIAPVLNAFAKILALSQENTPESRVAILNVIESLGSGAKTEVNDAKVSIEKEVEATQETASILEEIEQKNTSTSGEGRC